MKKEIEFLLFESGVSNYKISQITGISAPALQKYSNKTSDVENMTLGNAIKLYDCYQKLRKEKEIKTVDRDVLFGRLFAIMDVMGKRLFEKGRQSGLDRYYKKIDKSPMTTFNKMHAEVMEYHEKFTEKDEECVELVEKIVDQLGEISFDDIPLGDKWLLGLYKQRHALNTEKDYS